MERYIPKSALVAEIERIIKAVPRDVTDERLKAVYGNEYFILMKLLSFIDTLEVKEVDFDAEWERYFEHRGEMATVNVKHLAKYFFELGMAVSNKVQKGE